TTLTAVRDFKHRIRLYFGKNAEKSPRFLNLRFYFSNTDQEYRRRISEALVPPNPKEFDSATSILRSRALCGTRSIFVETAGLSRLSVAGAMLSRMASVEKIASAAPAAPSRWPMDDLVEDIETFDAASPTTRSTAPSSMVSAMVEVPCALM